MSKYFSIFAPAKLNLNLFVTEKIKNGFHLLESDICFLELGDKIFIRYNKDDNFSQFSQDKVFCVDNNDNLILKALNAFREMNNWNQKFSVYLKKSIPIGAGLGGGSADAAAILILLRNLYNRNKRKNKISIQSLYTIADKLGSDVPACLTSKDIKISGNGNQIIRKNIPNDSYFLVVNPKIILPTKNVFDKFDSLTTKEYKFDNFLFKNILIHNSLTSAAIELAPCIFNILSTLQKCKNIISYGMTGSGSSCFGIFKNIEDARNSMKNFSSEYFLWYGRKKNYSLNRVRNSKMLENKF